MKEEIVIVVEGRVFSGTADMLNYVSLLALKASDKFAEDRCYALAEEAQNISNAIYKELKERGVYDKED